MMWEFVFDISVAVSVVTTGI